MTILWDSDPAAAETYQFAVSDRIAVVEVAHMVTRELSSNPAELLVIVGPEVDLEAASTLAEQIRGERPEVSVILLRRRLDVAVLGQALRAGFREVIAADDLTALSKACRRSLEISRKLMGVSGGALAVDGKVIMVFNAKGGCGKTTIATNLGTYVASTGARALVVDLDLAFGDVAISLQLRPTASVGDLVAMTGHIDAQGIASVVTRHAESGLDTVCAPSQPGEVDRISGATVAELLRVARRSYDYVIIDTPPAFSEHVLAALDQCDLLVLLATLDIPAVKNLRLTLDTLDLLGQPRDSRIVILNRSDAKVGLHTEDVVAAIKQPIAAMIPSSPHVPASVNRGVAIVLDEPRHPVSLALRAFADKYILSTSPDSTGPLARSLPQPEQAKASRSLFRRSVKG